MKPQVLYETGDLRIYELRGQVRIEGLRAHVLGGHVWRTFTPDLDPTIIGFDFWLDSVAWTGFHGTTPGLIPRPKAAGDWAVWRMPYGTIGAEAFERPHHLLALVRAAQFAHYLGWMPEVAFYEEYALWPSDLVERAPVGEAHLRNAMGHFAVQLLKGTPPWRTGSQHTGEGRV